MDKKLDSNQVVNGTEILESDIKSADLEKKEGKKRGRPKVNREKKCKKTFTVFSGIYEEASKIASAEGRSVSEIIENYLKDYIKKNRNKY